jgi:copper transport protein
MIRTRERCPRRLVLAVVLAAVTAALVPAAASAHATLVATDPPAGARLTSPPDKVVLRFDEAYVSGSERVSLRKADGAPVPLPPVSGSGARIVQEMPSSMRGIYVVSWSLLSDDGHLEAGDFAFSVGAAGAIPAASTSTSSPHRSQVVASWLFFLGLALAFGGILSERLVWRAPPVRAPALPGIGIAAVASATFFALLSGDRASGGVVAGLHAHALNAVAQSRPGALTLGVIAMLAAAAVLAAAARTRSIALAPLAAAGILVATRGHAGTSGDWWAPLADSVHLLAAAAWTGALAHLVLVLVRTPDTRSRYAVPVHRYAHLALPTVLVVLGTGALSALAEFRDVASVFDTGYGRTLVVKGLIVLAGLGLALGSRLFALRGNPGLELPLLRRLTLAELGVVVAVLAAAGLLVNLAPPRSSIAAGAGAPLTPASASGPAIRLAGFAGRVAVGLAATRDELQFRLMPPDGRSPSGFELTAEAADPGGKSTTLYPRSCGSGCFAIRHGLRPGTTIVTATVASPDFPAKDVRFDVPGPVGRSRTDLLRRMEAAVRTAGSVDVVERLSAGGGGSTRSTSTFDLTGPGFLAADAVDSPTDVRVLGATDGLTELSFASGDGNTWYRVWIDAGHRLRRERIVRAGFLSERTLSYPTRARATVGPGPVEKHAIPTGPFVLAREDDDLAVGLAARPDGAGRLAVTTTVIGPDGQGASGLDVGVRLHSASVSARQATPCGAGCYEAPVGVVGTPRSADVTIRRLGRAPSRLRFPFPAHWPPPSATQLAARATRVFAALRTLTIDEHLGSDATNVRHTIWRLAAPDRLSYTIDGSSQAVVIGDRRWDRNPGTDWVESPQTPVRQPTPTWGGVPSRATLLGRGSVDGRPVWRISFVDRSIPAWYTVAIDTHTGRTLELEMTAAAHFMHHLYSGFDEPLSITPPT